MHYLLHITLHAFSLLQLDAKGQSDLSSHALKTEEPQEKEHGLGY